MARIDVRYDLLPSRGDILGLRLLGTTAFEHLLKTRGRSLDRRRRQERRLLGDESGR